MNKFDFSIAGGFPATQDVLDFLQGAYTESFLAIGKAIAGTASTDMAIISGCAVSGGTTSNGYIVANGEILPFVGGNTAATIVILEATLPGITYQSGITEFPRHQRYATFGTGSGSIAWMPSNTLGDISLISTLLVQKAALDNAMSTIVSLNNSLNNHITTGGHNWAQINNKPILLTSTIYLGDISGSDGYYMVNFPQPISGIYYVVGTLRTNFTSDADANYNNDCSFVIYSRTATYFKLAVREYGSVVQDLWFDYMVIRA
jgi:hypothetical protein